MQTYIYLGYVGVGANIAQNHSTSLWEVISGHHCPNSHEALSRFEHCSKSPSTLSGVIFGFNSNVPKVYPISNTFDLWS